MVYIILCLNTTTLRKRGLNRLGLFDYWRTPSNSDGAVRIENVDRVNRISTFFGFYSISLETSPFDSVVIV